MTNVAWRSAVQPLTKPIPTPCIGVCSTVFGDNVCRGCKRFSHEIISWNSYTNAQKRAVDDRLQQLLTRIVRGYLEVVDSQLLEQQIAVNKVASAAHRNAYCRAFDLLRAGAGQMDALENFGLQAVGNQQHLSAAQLKEVIDTEFRILSEAHYHRYFSVTERAKDHA